MLRCRVTAIRSARRTARTTIVWLRNDLRIDDNPALAAAVTRGGTVVPVFIWSPHEDGEWPPGAASRWWLHHALAHLADLLEQRGSRLILRRGDPFQVLNQAARSTSADAVFWNRRHEPAGSACDREIADALANAGVVTEEFNGALLFDPEQVQTSAGRPYTVFTPFAKACLTKLAGMKCIPAPRHIPPPRRWPQGTSLKTLDLLPRFDWTKGLRQAWNPGATHGLRMARRFLRHDLRHYTTARDRPDVPGTSRLSPYLHFGELSPRRLWSLADQARATSSKAVTALQRQLLWREFAYHLLAHFPQTTDHPLRSSFERFPWTDDETSLRAWERGLTGYPIVDAGMCELWTTGWMHNRVRMIVASFLTKHLLVSWQHGARWFWDTLVDADLANNTLGWQWTAGCGADAAPYFRIFNPVLQGERFDPRGGYVRQWLPVLARMPDRWLHRPWDAPDDILKAAGVALGQNYPRPIVPHAEARIRALAAYASIRNRS
jgi:deoxyribodipyrimidine photo-lyase